MERQKTNPFRTPEGYFESFPERLKDRLKSEEAEKPQKRSLLRLRPALAVAAAVAALALLTFPLVRILTPGSGSVENMVELAMLDDAGLFTSDYELAAYLEEYSTPLDDEEAYASQAIEYLASADVEMNLIFE